jgi:hypothetical protein
MINGKATFIPPSFWTYLTCCPLDVGLPTYRDTDRRLYYVWELVCEDPRCGGLTDVERRRMGKTFKSGSIILDRTSIYAHHHAGLQSKTSGDAKGVFLKTVVNFFKKFPDFFRPIYDQSKGVTPTSELRFFQTVVKGKRAESVLEGAELESWVDWGSSDIFHYDGTKLGTYVMDEFGKTMECDVWERWNVVRFCLDQDGDWCGKALLTSTIEDMESGGSAAKKIWDASDPSKRDKNGRTASGLYRFFLPAYETTFFDKYGMPDIEKGKQYYLNQRAGLEHDPRALSSLIRKNPFTIEEAFRVDGDDCLYDAMKLNARRDDLSWMEVTEKGNFEWVEKDKEVRWVKSANGRWQFCKAFQFDEPEHRNYVQGREGRWRPGNSYRYVSAVDPYDHDTTEDDRRSNAASYVKKKYFPGNENDPFNNAYICEYCARPSTSEMMYEDMVKQCFYFGCEILVESNKPGLIKYFKARGYEDFLISMPGNKDAGIAASKGATQTICELTEDYVYNNIEKVFFIKLIEDWLEFDPLKTTRFDRAMAFGYTEIADKHKLMTKNTGKLKDISDFLTLHKY